MYSVYYTKKIQAVIQAVVSHKSPFTRDPLFVPVRGFPPDSLPKVLRRLIHVYPIHQSRLTHKLYYTLPKFDPKSLR